VPRIILVEDDESLRTTLTEFLEQSGHEVCIAANGRIAWQFLEGQAFDLVITDLVMPDMEGLEFITKLRKAGHNIPIIAMTGGGRDIYLTLAEKLGARAILTKPFRLAELLEAVSSALKGDKRNLA
jgi:DNA-binding response OmpR family regulator